MNPNNDPLSRLATLTAAQDSKREAAKAANRARWPELAVVIDSEPGARLVCIHDHAGNLLAGQAPAPEFAISADFILFALSMGGKQK